MRFMLLVKAAKDFEEGVLPDEKMLSEMATYTEELVKAGALVGCERLQPSSTGTRVHYAKGKFTVTDGPFIETKELIAGYAILQFTSPAEALEWTKRFVQVDAPGRLNGECECEIRPVFEFETFGSSGAIERFRKLDFLGSPGG